MDILYILYPLGLAVGWQIFWLLIGYSILNTVRKYKGLPPYEDSERKLLMPNGLFFVLLFVLMLLIYYTVN